LLLVFTLAINRLQYGHFFPKRPWNLFVVACLTIYLLQVLALLYTDNFPSGLNKIQIKTTLVILTLALYYNNYLNAAFREKIMPFYILFLAITLLVCFVHSTVLFFSYHDGSVFFYYALVRIFDLHAVQFSILVYIGLIYLLDKMRRRSFMINKTLHLFAIVYLVFFIGLLSSKIVIIFSFCSILWYISLYRKKPNSSKKVSTLAVLGSMAILITLMYTKNPVSNRFKDIFSGKISVIEKNQFGPGDYFNGLQFRLLQWRLAGEILKENKAWLAGVSPGDAQGLLNKKYVAMNMYTGDALRGNKGFLDYNTHNAFLESILQTGIIGLLVFILICIGFIQMMVQKRSTEFWLIGTLLICYCFIESILETQYGVLIFTFFPLFLFYTTGRDSDKAGFA